MRSGSCSRLRSPRCIPNRRPVWAESQAVELPGASFSAAPAIRVGAAEVDDHLRSERARNSLQEVQLRPGSGALEPRDARLLRVHARGELLLRKSPLSRRALNSCARRYLLNCSSNPAANEGSLADSSLSQSSSELPMCLLRCRVATSASLTSFCPASD